MPAFRFLGVNVQRRVLTSTGKPVSDQWQNIDLGAAYRPFLVATGRRFEPDKPKYQKISFLGLVMKPLLQFRDKHEGAAAEPPAADDFENHYPEVETRLKNISSTLAALEEKAPSEIAAPPAQFTAGDFDPFNPSAAPSESPTKPGGMNDPTKVVAGAGQTIPEHCLIRLIDLTIEPGLTYQYRIQVRMANPNYERTDVADPSWAKEMELHSDKWYTIPEAVTVPPELRYYAVDQQQVDEAAGKKYTGPNPGYLFAPDRQTLLQVHRWLGAVAIPTMGSKEPLMIGEWAVADRVAVYRGEYADRKVRLELPVWSETHNAFLVPVDRPGREKRFPGIEVNFSHENEKGYETVLVDFDGGRQQYRLPPKNEEDKPATIEDSSATEVLLMTPEGKLLGHDTSTDSVDHQRIEDRKIAAHRVEIVRHGKDAVEPPGKKTDPFGNPKKP
jgi:hypothetical protein